MVLTKKDDVILLIDSSLQGVALGLLAMPGALSKETSLESSLESCLIWTAVEPQPSAALVVLSETIQKGLAAKGLVLGQITGLAVSVGPGSFTGMRIGLAYAYGLGHGFSRGIKSMVSGEPGFRGYFGISSLEAAAQDLAVQAKAPVTLVIPSTRTHGFWARATPEGEVTHKAALLDLTSQSLPVAGEGALGQPESHVILFGQWPLFAQKYLEQGKDLLKTIDPDQLCSSALRGMARASLKAGIRAFSDRHPEPLFLRLSTAEEQRLSSRPPPSPSSPSSILAKTNVCLTEELP